MSTAVDTPCKKLAIGIFEIGMTVKGAPINQAGSSEHNGL